MDFYANVSDKNNCRLIVMPKLSLFSKVMNNDAAPFYKIWRNYFIKNNNILYVRPVKICLSFLREDNTTTLNVYHKIIYDKDKLRKVNLNSRLNLFLKYY